MSILHLSVFGIMNLDPHLLRLLQSVRLWLALTIFFGGLIGVLIIAQAYTLSHIIAGVFLRGATLDTTWNTLLVLLAIIAARAVLAWGSEVSAFQIAARIKRNLRERLLAHILTLGPAYARGERTGELTNTLVEGIESLDAYLSQYLPQLVLAALVPLSILLFVFPLDALSGLVLLITGPLVPLFMILIGNAADALTRRQYRELSRMSAHFLDMLQGLTTLKLFGQSRAQIETIARISTQYRDTTLGVLRVAFLSAFALEMIATISTAIVAVEVGLRLLYGQLPFEQAFFVLVLAPDFYIPLRLLGTRFHAGMTGVAAAARIFEILETTGDDQPQTVVFHQRSAVGPQPPAVIFNDVHYTYPGDRVALNGVSFEIAPGQRVAIVGATGAGKSTIVSLLLRFIPPSCGEIRLGDKALGDLSPAEWRAQITWVPQNPYLFNESIADNIRLARPTASRDEIVQAAKLAHADEFIDALPQGYDTIVGERGARLSAGQAQRIAIARAFLKNASILIFDEATANLDVENTARIQESIERLTRNRTTLLITHQLDTAIRADQIIVLDAGCVVETGTHAALMQAHGAYFRLVTVGYAEPVTNNEWRVTREIGKHTNVPGPSIGNHELGTKNPDTRHSALVTFFRLLRFVAPFKGWIALAVLLGTLTIGSSIGLMATSAYIIASAARHPSIADLAVPIVGVRFFGIARGVFRYLERYVSHVVNFNVLTRLRVWFYTAIEPLAPAQLLTNAYRSGDLLARIVGDIETLQNFYVRVLAPPLIAIMIAIIIAAFLAGYAFVLAFIVLVFMFVVGIVIPLVVQHASRRTHRRWIDARAELNTQLVDTIQGIADVVAFGRAQMQIERGRRLSDELIHLQTRMATLTGAHNAAGNFLAYLALWCALVAAIPLVVSAQLDGVNLPVIVLAMLASFEGVLALPLAFQYLEANLHAARRLFEIANTRPHPTPAGDKPTEIVFVSSQLSASNPGIHVDDLSFRYAPGEALALDHVSFDLPAGKHIALVGASGAGKSTLVNVLLRFWDDYAGQILVGGRNLYEYAPEVARTLFGVVPQTTHLFNTTIRQNLLLARPDASEEQLAHAAQQAQVHDFITALPQGYATMVGEQGLRLSGGERQRLALARALLRDAPILLLDEPTANLDRLTERQILHTLSQIAARKTLLMITHRLLGLENMDEIIVLHQGQVVERGTHKDLLNRNGFYRKMILLQEQFVRGE